MASRLAESLFACPKVDTDAVCEDRALDPDAGVADAPLLLLAVLVLLALPSVRLAETLVADLSVGTEVVWGQTPPSLALVFGEVGVAHLVLLRARALVPII